MSAESYNQFPYHDLVIPQTHPNRLAGVARLFGLSATSPSRARILELGCGTGLNILSIACSMPESSCLGVDYAEKQIEIAEMRRQDAGVGNVTFQALSVLDLGEKYGKFDYIIAHGLFSWVSDEVREAVLRICKQNLAENGIAYVSYNVLPGGYARQIQREGMLFHTAQLTDNEEKVAEGIKFAKLMTAQASFQVHFGAGVHEVANKLDQHPGAYIFHEYFADENKSFYFSDFVNQAAARGLCYVADADFSSMLGGKIEQGLRTNLFQSIPDRVRREQYFDFLSPRSFRRTLLTHGTTAVSDALAHPGPDEIGFALRVTMQKIEPFTNTPFEVSQITDPRLTFHIGHDVPLKVILSLLHTAAPQVLVLGELQAGFVAAYRNAGQPLPVPEAQFQGFFFFKMIEALAAEYVDVLAEPWPGVGAGSVPRATMLARYQCHRQETVISFFHTMNNPDPAMAALIELADGKRDLEMIAAELADKVLNGDLVLEFLRGASDAKEIASIFLRSLPENLDKGRRLGFFDRW